jgi:hypothetical protein
MNGYWWATFSVSPSVYFVYDTTQGFRLITLVIVMDTNGWSENLTLVSECQYKLYFVQNSNVFYNILNLVSLSEYFY